jgi:hypothetical protein
MSTNQRDEVRGPKAKKTILPVQAGSNAGPTTFFLKTEKEMEQSVQRGRKLSRSSVAAENKPENRPPAVDMSTSIAETTYGVQSLEDTINSGFSSSSDLSRASSQSNDEHSPAAGRDGKTLLYKKRKAGNRVHPTIRSAGHRIISSENSPHSPSMTASPISARSTESPLRTHSFRRGSNSSSINFNHLLTPVKSNPKPFSAAPSTPRSASAKSFQLSDEEACLADEIGSQAIFSSHGDDDVDLERTPQLVMPSLAMPERRAFTQQGRSMGRLKVMVIGPRGSGKTSLISNILATSEHVVHVDSALSAFSDQASTRAFLEISASTKPLPTWWVDLDSKTSARRRMSVGDVLDRNIIFIDSPPAEDDDQIRRVSEYIAQSTRRAVHIDGMSDVEIMGMLAGDGGVQMDAVIYIFASTDTTSPPLLTDAQQECLRLIAECTNLIPVIGHADQMTNESLSVRKCQIEEILKSSRVETYRLADGTIEPLAVSSARGSDADVIDASLLMSSKYMPQLVSSELHYLVEHLFDPSNMARLRHLSAQKAAAYRKNHPAHPQPLFHHTHHQQSHTGHLSPVISTGSVLDEASKVLVPYGTSSYYRSTSPTISDFSAPSSSAYAVARYNESPRDPNQPIREIVTAQWAEDLTHRGRDPTIVKPISQTFPQYFSSGLPSDTESDPKALTLPQHQHSSTSQPQRPSRGRLGGALCVIDPRDPLGVLAFGQRSYFALRVAGGCGLLGALCYCVVRFWTLGWELSAIGGGQVHAMAVPAPTRTWEGALKGVFPGWAR